MTYTLRQEKSPQCFVGKILKVLAETDVSLTFFEAVGYGSQFFFWKTISSGENFSENWVPLRPKVAFRRFGRKIDFYCFSSERAQNFGKCSFMAQKYFDIATRSYNTPKPTYEALKVDKKPKNMDF